MWHRAKKQPIGSLSNFKVTNLLNNGVMVGCYHIFDKDLGSNKNYASLADDIQSVLKLWPRRGITSFW